MTRSPKVCTNRIGKGCPQVSGTRHDGGFRNQSRLFPSESVGAELLEMRVRGWLPGTGGSSCLNGEVGCGCVLYFFYYRLFANFDQSSGDQTNDPALKIAARSCENSPIPSHFTFPVGGELFSSLILGIW